MSQAEMELAQQLSHDVGKYVARTAINLALPLRLTPAPFLLRMLIDDLYGQEGAIRPSSRFERLSGDRYHPAYAECRQLFFAIDALETRVRGGDPIAVSEAAECALSIRRHLLNRVLELSS